MDGRELRLDGVVEGLETRLDGGIQGAKPGQNRDGPSKFRG